MEDEPTSPLAAFLGNRSASWFGASPADDDRATMGTSSSAGADLTPLGLPLFEADKVFAVQAAREAGGAKKSASRVRSLGACQPQRVCDPMDGLAPGNFLQGIFGVGAGDGDEDGDRAGASSSPSIPRVQTTIPRSSRRASSSPRRARTRSMRAGGSGRRDRRGCFTRRRTRPRDSPNITCSSAPRTRRRRTAC